VWSTIARQRRREHSEANENGTMKFARVVFWAAAIYGVLVTFPLYFGEQTLAAQYPPAVTHPEYYYSFVGVTLVWQILFVFIALNPERHCTIMIPCVIEKLSLFPTFFILSPQGRFPHLWVPLMIIDLFFGVLFFVAFKKTRNQNRRPGAT